MLTPTFIAAIALLTPAPVADPILAMRERGLTDLYAFEMLRELTAGGSRLSGSEGAAKAVAWSEATMRRLGFENVRLVPCRVPHWVRGDKESATLLGDGGGALSVAALGGSDPTPEGGITAEVVEVGSLAEAAKLGDRAKGKIVFFNGAFDAKLASTFPMYGGAVGQRVNGASTVSPFGAVAVLVRSMTLSLDDEPHTGTMRYVPGTPRIPAAALSLVAANRLSKAVHTRPTRVTLQLSCEWLPDAPSANVVGEIAGTEFPGEVIVMGGHLDSWDLGVGAHDDGAGCVQAVDALRLIKEAVGRPKRTVRVVLFMDEEQRGTGAEAYAFGVKMAGEKHLAAIESDAGGFMPRSFGTSIKVGQDAKLRSWLPDLAPLGIERFNLGGGGGADVAPLGPLGAALFGLTPDNQRYFDYHHSRNDTLDKVNPRELQMGALAMATLAWKISENGL